MALSPEPDEPHADSVTRPSATTTAAAVRLLVLALVLTEFLLG